jgi:hypothetical protein
LASWKISSLLVNEYVLVAVSACKAEFRAQVCCGANAAEQVRVKAQQAAANFMILIIIVIYFG